MVNQRAELNLKAGVVEPAYGRNYHFFFPLVEILFFYLLFFYLHPFILLFA